MNNLPEKTILFKLLLSNPVLFAKKIFQRLIFIYKRFILKDVFEVNISKWFKDKGDETLRLDYPELNDTSVVFDLGGYRGDFAQAINDKYGCKVYLFEPHPKYYKICVDRFAQNEKVIPLNYALSYTDGVSILYGNDDRSSFLNQNHSREDAVECQVKEILSTMKELNVSSIDLMKINIEGGEYPLLNHMMLKNKLFLVSQYQIQFHKFIENAELKRDRITAALSKTHYKTWCYTFVWENWKKKLKKNESKIINY